MRCAMKMKQALIKWCSIWAVGFTFFWVAVDVVDFVATEGIGNAELNGMGMDIVTGIDFVVFIISEVQPQVCSALLVRIPLRSCRSTSAMCHGAHLGLPSRFADIAMRCSAACRASPETRMSSSRVPCPFITNTIETPKRNSKNTYNFKNIVFLVLCHRNNGISH